MSRRLLQEKDSLLKKFCFAINQTRQLQLLSSTGS